MYITASQNWANYSLIFTNPHYLIQCLNSPGIWKLVLQSNACWSTFCQNATKSQIIIILITVLYVAFRPTSCSGLCELRWFEKDVDVTRHCVPRPTTTAPPLAQQTDSGVVSSNIDSLIQGIINWYYYCSCTIILIHLIRNIILTINEKFLNHGEAWSVFWCAMTANFLSSFNTRYLYLLAKNESKSIIIFQPWFNKPLVFLCTDSYV